MTNLSGNIADANRQQSIRDKCFHPTGKFIEFKREEIEQSIPDRFEKIVRQFPDRIAVRTRNDTLTYTELNAMANRVAHTLLERQGRKTQLVAILLEKDVPQLAAMLAVMKAGKFFLILDPSFPKARIAAMLEDSRAKLVVTNRRHASLASEVATSGCQLMEWESIDGATSSDDIGLRISPKALAFINYTSGSTGEPKGLLRTHRMILHNIMLRTNLVHVCEHDRISLLSSGTSNAITNTFLALLNGAGLFPLELKKESMMRLAGWLSEERITICPMSSPLFRSLCETLSGKDNFPDLRVVRLRSEAVYKDDADLYKTYFSPGCVFVTGLSSNETGPLRDFLIDHQTEVSGSAVPVGYAAPGKEIFLLDDAGKEVGLGEVGEIAVRSRYLSPGYLRRPQLTKAKFRPDPKGEGERLYLTGDLGVMLPDGCLIYKGRKDFRIKIRGYGVDLKEVELALRNHPAVADAVVVARENERREKELIGYFTSSIRTCPTESELRSFLGQTLADYMIPSAFVMLDSIPLTPHNKVDRDALPPPGHFRLQLDTPFSAPRTELEQGLAKIWAEVLCHNQFGMHDNFYDLGGHSLAATRIISRVIETYGLQVPVQALYDSPTIAKMAAVIMDHPKIGDGSVPSDQATINKNKVRPTNEFIEIEREEVEQSIPERFEKIVKMYPDRLAARMGDRALTYEELNKAANRIAHAIIDKRGPGSEPIALLFEHGIDFIAAMLGVHKAGKLYVPLDPAFPAERVKYILKDSETQLIVTNNCNLGVARTLLSDKCALLNIDEIKEAMPSENLCIAVYPDDLEAICFTSGSEGQAKGVKETHRNSLYTFSIIEQRKPTCVDDRLSLIHSLCFGSARIHLHQALFSGASLFPFDVKSEGIRRMVQWLEDEQITVLHAPPAVFRQLADCLSGQERLTSLRLIYLSGAPITKQDFNLYKKHFSTGTLFGCHMASTEARAIGSAIVDQSFRFPEEGAPVGYAFPGKKVMILDENGREIGPNQIGEIAVKSRYLNQGYWNRPDLTNTKFLTDPDGGDERICLTGDLGKMLPDGFLIHLGRKDSMVKIRGYRVELSEVERTLLGNPQIREAAVVAWNRDLGEKYVVAYVVAQQGGALTISKLRDFLSQKLPDYMLPSTFVFLESLPLTNGKVDRKALPRPDEKRPKLSRPYVPPRSEVEQGLVNIWEEVLGVRPVGIHDNFFDLGGHSLMATQVISRVINAFKVEVPIKSLFESPTVADMVVVITENMAKKAGDKELARMLAELESLTDEEARQRLAEEGK